MVYPKIKADLIDELDDKMQEGYMESSKGNAVAASNIWKEVWEMVKKTMDAYGIEYMEDMDDAFQGQQSIFNWSTDCEFELYKASKENSQFLQQRIDFCKEYIMKSREKDNLNNLVRKRSIAESFFLLGNVQEGERRFQAYVNQYPSDDWGWINWSDQYGSFALEENRDNEKAIEILRKGLEVSGQEDRVDMLERLKDLYTEEGMEQAAKDAGEEVRTEAKKNQERQRNAISLDWEQPNEVVNTASSRKKIGRNELCPCGSGKKYKKCCGK